MRLNRSILFRTAWRNARLAAMSSGRALRAEFAKALRAAWASVKALARSATATASALASTAGAIAAELRAAKSAGVTFGTAKPWRFANAAWR